MVDKLLKSASFGSRVPVETEFHNTNATDSATDREPVLPAAKGGGVESKNTHCDELLTFIDDDDSDEVNSQNYTIVRKITTGRYGEVYEGIPKEPFTNNGQHIKVALKKVSMHSK